MTENREQPKREIEKPYSTYVTEEELDEAIEDSMDASDPPSYVSKGTPTTPRKNRKEPQRNRDEDKSGKA